MLAVTLLTPPPPFTNIGPRVIRRIWSGHLRVSSTGPQPSAPQPPRWSASFWKESHTRSRLPCLPGYPQLGQDLLGDAPGSGQPAGIVIGSLFLPESEIHPEAIARSATHARLRQRPLRTKP